MAMLSRVDFGRALQELEEGSHKYFQPPDGKKIQYPCFIYSRDTGHTQRADNMRYSYADGYYVLYITSDPDTTTPKKVLNRFPYCSDGKPYVKDKLYHYPFTIYLK